MRRIFFFVLAAFSIFASAGSAQAPGTVRGVLVNAAGQPVAGERVVLHRVVGSTGANIAETRSGADGRFVVPVDSADDAEAVYFLAARWEGELYISEAFRAPLDTAEHRLQVGVPGTSASALIDGSATGAMPAGPPPQAAPGSPATPTNWMLLLIPSIALVGVALYFVLRGRTQTSPRRRLLAEVAALDLAQAGDVSEEYRAERTRLLEQLRQTAP
jgi:5-hydroxyisourate hydrolase-like protein (transthyretin family)